MNSESPWATKRPIPFTSVSGETIPAFAPMAITGLVYENGIAFLQCDKPSTTFVREVAVNNMFDVPAGLRGTCFRAGDLRVLYDGGSPLAGEGWGLKPGQWSLSRGYPGFAIQGIVDSQHRIAKAFFEPIVQVLVKTTAPVAADATTDDYRVYAGPFGAEADAGFTTVPTARNRTGQSMATDEWAWLAWTGGGWELRCQQNRVYHCTYASSPLAAGSPGDIALPDGRAVTFINWSTDTTINTSDRILVWQDFTDSGFYGMRAGESNIERVWHGVALADIAASTPGNVSRIGTTPVTAVNWSNNSVDIANGEFVFVWQSPVNSLYYCIKSGDNGVDNGAIVTVYGSAADGSCLWPGKIAAPLDGSSYCSDQFPNGADCWLTVLNSADGSTATTTATLNVGEHYIGRQVGTIASVPVYAIRIESSSARWFHATLDSPGLASGAATAAVTTTAALDGGTHPGAVTANNTWGCAGQIAAPCLIVKDASGNYELVKVKAIVVEATTEILYDAVSERILKYKRQEIAVMHEGDESAWQNIFVAEARTLATAVGYNATTNRVYYEHRDLWTLPASDGILSVTVWHQLVEKNVVDGVSYDATTHTLSFDNETLTVWENADASDTFIELFTTTVITAVTNVYLEGIDLIKDRTVVTVLNPSAVLLPAIVFNGTLCDATLAGPSVAFSQQAAVRAPAAFFQHPKNFTRPTIPL